MAARGQFSVAAAVVIAVSLLLVTAYLYSSQLTFVETRSRAAAELVASIAGDFKRALASMLSLATRCYFNYTEYRSLCSVFTAEGLDFSNRHNMTAARAIALTFLNTWLRAQVDAHSGYGLRVRYSLIRVQLQADRPYRVIPADPREGLIKCYWYYPDSISAAAARLEVDLLKGGVYGWKADILVTLSLEVNPQIEMPEGVEPGDLYTGPITVEFRVLQDSMPYSSLFSEGRLRIYYASWSDGEVRWVKVRPSDYLDLEYVGNGLYRVVFKAVNTRWVQVGDYYTVPMAVVVEDGRGIVVESLTYTYTSFAVVKRTPDEVYHMPEYSSTWESVEKPLSTGEEVYTLELTWNTTLFWLGRQLPRAGEPPPVPLIPIKQLRVNVTSDGTLSTLRERPVQYEVWRRVWWPPDAPESERIAVWIPEGLADLTMDYNESVRLVFQVAFPRRDIRRQYVVVWWLDDLDTEPPDCRHNPLYCSCIEYYDPPDDPEDLYRDLRHPAYTLELLDVEHRRARGYVDAEGNRYDYHGVAAVVVHDSSTDACFGPWNLYAVGTYQGSYLGWYRPYGEWRVFYRYRGRPEYEQIEAPIRIIAVLNTSLVGNVYEEGDVRSDLYDTLVLLEVVNGTRYVPVRVYVYWKRGVSASDGYLSNGLWFSTLMGGGFPEMFMYLTRSNVSRVRDYYDPSPADEIVYSGDTWITAAYYSPGIFAAQWNESLGRALIMDEEGVEYLNSQPKPVLGVTHFSPSGEQRSLEHWACWYDTSVEISWGTVHAYQLVLFMFKPTGGAAASWRDGWVNAYVYAPMFLEAYAPLQEYGTEEGAAAQAPGGSFKLTAERPGSLSGTLSFKARTRGRIITSEARIRVRPGDLVELVVDDSDGGLLAMGFDGYLSLQEVHVAELRINGRVVATDVDIVKTTGLKAQPSTVSSSLKLVVTGEGYTYLEVGGSVLIDGNSTQLIEIYGVRPGGREGMYISWSAALTEAFGVAERVEIEG